MRVAVGMPQQELRDMLSFFLETRFQAQVANLGSAQEAISYLAKDDKVELLVLSYPECLSSLPKLRALPRQVPIILHSDTIADSFLGTEGLAVLGSVCHPTLLELLDELIVLKFRPEELASGPTRKIGTYHRIKTSLLLGMNPLPGDVFLRLNGAKHLKVFNKGAQFDAEDNHKYGAIKKVEYLYLQQDSTAAYIETLKAHLVRLNAQTSQAGRLSGRSPEVAASEALETVRELLHVMGPTKEVGEMMKSSVRATMQSIVHQPKLKGLLAKIALVPDRYISFHSTQLSQVACSLAAAMGWASEPTFYRLTMAGMMHDLSLNNDKLAQVDSLEELERRKGEFTEDEARNYKLHGAQAAEMTHKFAEIPSDVDLIIRQHHEKADGRGFPRGLIHSQIAPLAAVFIVAHDLLDEVYRLGPSFDMAKFLEQTGRKYAQGTFRKLHQALKAMHVEKGGAGVARGATKARA